mmetsp:Transcript_100271/g.321548  ORF Transcript_100271/g.321548 Transcript_100271/m.321548 type:complete len:841 (-) Transcript_100271:157-2679(-)|eukprot:CAMPEP_0203930208 /NCGR_PEP_ID=MMETSP0359-20131031/68983_1 /ASSEMBLY_ACC=CAM_ASM_000338 /TAXON_ID=268821 /ORGANISM="Scrippsiella Hangoei, Strain SHTV-5" /LENGTH=840 /DNA_ID=CAMNT_0050859347 /DNA_START=200 /DNA_END=2722 /DNA_ORIENTATION=+
MFHIGPGETSSYCFSFPGLQRWFHRGLRLHPKVWSSASEPVSPEAQQQVSVVLARSTVYGRGLEDRDSPVSLCQIEVAAYTGFRYCVAANSYTSALFLALKAAGVGCGAHVLGNSVTSLQVPAAVRHAGGKFISIGNTQELFIDNLDLVQKVSQTRCRCLVISHMYGQIPNMDEVSEICKQYGITLIEDCSNSLGNFRGSQHVGHHGAACCFSGEHGTILGVGPLDGGGGGSEWRGSFVLSNDLGIASRLGLMSSTDATSLVAGSSSSSIGIGGRSAGIGGSRGRQQPLVTSPQAMHPAGPRHRLPALNANYGDGLPVPSYRLHMSNIVAEILRPQIASLESRIREANRRHKWISDRFLFKVDKRLRDEVGFHMPFTSGKCRVVRNSFCFVATTSCTASHHFLELVRVGGVPVETHGLNLSTSNNDLNPVAIDSRTALYHSSIPHRLSEKDCLLVADILAAALVEVIATCSGGLSRDASKKPTHDKSTSNTSKSPALVVGASSVAALASQSVDDSRNHVTETSGSTCRVNSSDATLLISPLDRLGRARTNVVQSRTTLANTTAAFSCAIGSVASALTGAKPINVVAEIQHQQQHGEAKAVGAGTAAEAGVVIGGHHRAPSSGSSSCRTGTPPVPPPRAVAQGHQEPPARPLQVAPYRGATMVRVPPPRQPLALQPQGESEHSSMPTAVQTKSQGMTMVSSLPMSASSQVDGDSSGGQARSWWVSGMQRLLGAVPQEMPPTCNDSLCDLQSKAESSSVTTSVPLPPGVKALDAAHLESHGRGVFPSRVVPPVDADIRSAPKQRRQVASARSSNSVSKRRRPQSRRNFTLEEQLQLDGDTTD